MSQAETRRETQPREKTRENKSSMLEGRKRHQRGKGEEKERGKKPALLRKEKKGSVAWRRLASDSRHIFLFALPPPFSSSPSSSASYRMPAVGRRFRPKIAFLAFRYDELRDIYLSPFVIIVEI